MPTARSYQWLWFQAFLAVLAGYALAGKGFAYFYLGDLMVFLGFFLFLWSRKISFVLNDITLTSWLFFALWGIMRTIPYLRIYKFDAVRDAVLWGYGILIVILPAFIRRKEQVYAIFHKYMKFLKWYLPFAPIPMLASSVFIKYVPKLPWAKLVPIVYIKSGDMGVYLAGAALFLLLFPQRSRARSSRDISLVSVLQIIGFVVCLIVVAAASRGGFLATMMAIAMVSILRPQKTGFKVVVIGVATLTLAIALLELNPFSVKIKGHDLNADQIAKLLASIGSDSASAHQGTEKWRLVWWTKIVHYTVLGPYRWTGKGFGVNLALVDGPPGIGKDEQGLRSPHNGSMTVLARMGIPGLFFWLAIQSTFVMRLILAYQRSMRIGATSWARVYLWILGFWMAAFINMSFDVYIEGPQGGILFWSIIGFGIAALRIGKIESRKIVALNSLSSPMEGMDLKTRSLPAPIMHVS